MSVFDAIESRRTVHMYKQSQIDETTLRRALQMALLAPNHKFTFPWKFIVVGDETRKKLKTVAIGLKKAKKPLSQPEEEALERRLRSKMDHPAALVVFCMERTENAFQQREDYASVACAIQNFTLALSAEGYGTKWGTGDLTRAPQTYETLGVDPEVFEIVGFLWVGHSAVDLPPQKRPQLDEVLQILP